MPITGVPPVVAAIYATDAGQSIPHQASPIVDFEDQIMDSHNAVTIGAAWKFTAPMSGLYLAGAVVLFAATTTWADGEAANVKIHINGVLAIVLDRKETHGTAENVYLQLGGIGLLSLNAGDYVDFRVYQASGAALSLLNDVEYNRIFIVKYAGA